MVDVSRIHPMADQLFAGNSILIKPETARTRISLRAPSDQIDTINDVLGLDLPTRPKTTSVSDERIAMWLGPDEWLIMDSPKSDLVDLPNELSQVLCSPVDISHRNTAINLTGNNVTKVLNSGCPQNLSLSVFPVGACSRTIMGKSEVILYRTAQNTFHLECWRSFSQYVWKFLVAAAKSA